MSFTRRSGSGRPHQTSRREDRPIVRNASVQPTASSAAIQALVPLSLWAPVSSRTIRRRLTEGHLGSRRPLRVLSHPSMPPFGVVPCTRKLDCSGMELGCLFINESRFNLSSDDNRGRVWRPRGERLNPVFALQ
ncbi:transposable element Tcb2 transposase [Trichonephila clavipes]|nr:transposable element Tcb2 transposase [Trichonephila clavipes]